MCGDPCCLIGMPTDLRKASWKIVRNAPVSTNRRAGCPRIEQGTVKAPFSSRRKGILVNFSCRSDRTEIHLSGLIHLKENKFCPAIDHGFVPGENIQTQNAINGSAASVGMARLAQRHRSAAKTHAASYETLREPDRE